MFTFDVVKTDQELEKLQAFRSQMFAAYLPQWAREAGRDDDSLDKESCNVVAYADNRIAGCLRLTFPASGWYAPQFCDLPPLPYSEGEMAELNRFAVAPPYRDLTSTKTLRRGMTQVILQFAQDRNIRTTISVTHQGVYKLIWRQDGNSGAITEVPSTEKPYEGYYVGFRTNDSNPLVAFTTDVARYLTFVETAALNSKTND